MQLPYRSRTIAWGRPSDYTTRNELSPKTNHWLACKSGGVFLTPMTAGRKVQQNSGQGDTEDALSAWRCVCLNPTLSGSFPTQLASAM